MKVLPSFLAPFFLVGCVLPAQLAQERFAREFRCPVEKTKLKSLGANAYRVRGCGRSAQYVCIGQSEVDTVCTREYDDSIAQRAQQAPARTEPRALVRRKQDSAGIATFEANITGPTPQWLLGLRCTPTTNGSIAVWTIRSPTPVNECSLDLVINGERKDVPAPTRGSDPRHMFLEIPLQLLHEVAVSQRTMARVCTTTWEVDTKAKAALSELLMRVREEMAFAQPPSAPAEPTPTDTSQQL